MHHLVAVGFHQCSELDADDSRYESAVSGLDDSIVSDASTGNTDVDQNSSLPSHDDSDNASSSVIPS